MKRVNNQVQCIHCGSEQTKVLNTGYAERGEIVRYRKCGECGETFYTIQDFEVALADNVVVKYPARGTSEYSQKKVQIVIT